MISNLYMISYIIFLTVCWVLMYFPPVCSEPSMCSTSSMYFPPTRFPPLTLLFYTSLHLNNLSLTPASMYLYIYTTTALHIPALSTQTIPHT